MSGAPRQPDQTDIDELQSQITDLQKQVTDLKEAQNQQDPEVAIIDPPIWLSHGNPVAFTEWRWKMYAKLDSMKSVDEKTKIRYVASRLSGPAFSWVVPYLPTYAPEGTAKPVWKMQNVDTAYGIIDVLYRLKEMYKRQGERQVERRPERPK